MAKTPEFTAVLSPTNYNPEPIVNRFAGVEGPSAFERMADIAKVGASAYDAYRKKKISDIQSQISQEIAPLIEEATLGSPSMQQEVREEKAAAEYTLRAMPLAQGPETGEQLDTLISGVTTNLNKSLGFLSRAEKQKRLTPFELQQRSLAVVRKYLSDNPGMRREILSTVSNAFQDQGIMERLKIDEQLLKSQGDAVEAQDKAIRQEFKERNIALMPFMRLDGSLDIGSAQNMIDQVRQEEFAYQTADRALKTGEVADKITINNLIKTGDHVKIANGYVRNAWSTASKIINSGANYNDIVNNLEMQLDSLTGDLDSNFASLGNDPTIGKTVQETKARIENIKKTAKDSGSLENLKTYMNNQGTIDGLIDKAQVRAEVGNLERLEILSKFSTSPWIAKLITQGETATVTKMIKDLVNMEKGIRIGIPELTKNGNAPSSAEVAFDAASDSINGGNADAVNMFATNTSDRVKAIANIQDVDQRYLQSESFVKQVAEPKNLNALKTLSVEAKTEAVNLIIDHSKALTSSLKRLSDREGVEFSFTDEGKLVANGVTKQENADVVDRINTSLSAYSNLRGVSTKSASQEFFSNIYNNVFTADQVPSVADTIKETVDVLMPIMTKIESGGKMYDKQGKLLTSPKGAQGKFQIMPATGRRPGYGITPVDYTKTGKALESEMERFARDYLTAALTEFNGDSRKALASYNAGIQAVKNAELKAAKAGKPNEWLSNLPEETRNYLVKANLNSEQAQEELPALVKSLHDQQLAIQKANPAVFEQLFRGSSVEMAKDIAQDLAEKHGVAPSWQEVHQVLEQEGQVTPMSRDKVLPLSDNKDMSTLKPIPGKKETKFKFEKVPSSKDTIEYQKALGQAFSTFGKGE